MRALLSLGRLFLTVSALAAFTFPASGASVVIAPAKDNTLYESPAGTLSNGAGDFLFAGQTGPTDGVNIRRGLLAFDVAASIPAGAMVTNVSLTLFVTRVAAGGFNRQVSLSRVTGDWGEASSRAPSPEGSGGTALTGDATWRHQFFPGDMWTTAGGDFVAQASAATTILGAGQSFTWTGNGMISDVQLWLNNPAVNFGWILRGHETSTQTAIQFNSRTHPSVDARPELTVEYEVIPEPTSAVLALTALSLLVARRPTQFRRHVRASSRSLTARA